MNLDDEKLIAEIERELSWPPLARRDAENLHKLIAIVRRQQAREAKLCDALTKCMDRFGEYERAHLNAGKSEKAARNGEMRQLCREAMDARS